MITAKVTCNLMQTYGEGENAFATVGFCPDYTDDRNKEWAKATPHLDLRMTLHGQAIGLFEVGKAYTLQFVEGDAAADQAVAVEPAGTAASE